MGKTESNDRSRPRDATTKVFQRAESDGNTTTDAEVNTIENRGIRAGSLLCDAEKAIEEGAMHREQDDDR